MWDVVSKCLYLSQLLLLLCTGPTLDEPTLRRRGKTCCTSTRRLTQRQQVRAHLPLVRVDWPCVQPLLGVLKWWCKPFWMFHTARLWLLVFSPYPTGSILHCTFWHAQITRVPSANRLPASMHACVLAWHKPWYSLILAWIFSLYLVWLAGEHSCRIHYTGSWRVKCKLTSE